MTDAAFIRAIHAAPEDAAPRLVFADWLEEHGDPERADLIRRMCRVPTYVFTWSRRARHGRHVHAERIGDIRGLKGRVETVWAVWLDPAVEDSAKLLPMLRSYPADEMLAVPANPAMNKPSFEGPECLATPVRSATSA